MGNCRLRTDVYIAGIDGVDAAYRLNDRQVELPKTLDSEAGVNGINVIP